MSDTDAISDLDAQIELRSLQLDVLNRRPLDPKRYFKLIEDLQRNRESRAKRLAAESRKGKKTLASGTPLDFDKLFSEPVE